MKPKYPKIKVPLSGQDGNAFFIIGRISAALRKGGVDPAEIAAFQKEAMGGDYAHVLQAAMNTVSVS